jgi:hypothetical protein
VRVTRVAAPCYHRSMPGTLHIEEVDLEAVAAHLQAVFSGSPIEGSVVGRTQMRGALSDHLGCSELDAERLIDTMIGRGFLALQRMPDGRSLWRIRATSR